MKENTITLRVFDVSIPLAVLHDALSFEFMFCLVWYSWSATCHKTHSLRAL